MRKKHWTMFGLALGALVLGVLVGLMTVGTVAADPTPGVKIQIPRIDVGDVLETGDWETWIQVQNVGTVDTGAIFMGWGEYSGLCPTNDPGVIVHYCALIRENALWTLRTQLATDEIKSGIIYTVTADVYQEACSTAELTEHNTDMWREWLKEWKFGTGMDITKHPAVEMTWGPAQGEEVSVTVTRYGPNDYGTFVSSTYTGISEEMEGEDHPWEYYAPYVMKGYNGLDTELTIQNSGEACTSVWIHYKEQESCANVYDQHIEQLAPGEAVRVRVPCNTAQIPCMWLGSARISAEQPLGIVVDETSFAEPCIGSDGGTLLTHRARSKVELRDGEVITDTIVYADLLFREWNGWDASIQVQNLSRTGQNTFVTVDFLDNSGDEILFLGDWVCPGGSKTFYLPIVADLGFFYPQYVGAAEIQSHDQVSYPGEETPAQPIFAVVDLKKPDSGLTPALDAQGGSYNAHPYSQKEWVSEIALPFMAKGAQDMYTPWTSWIAIRNNSNCNKIKAKIWFKIETGELLCELRIPWLHPKHVKLIDLNDIGCLYPGYVGSAKVIVEDFEQLCDVDNDGHMDNEPLMPSVIVVEKGHYGSGIDEGDVTNIYEGIPYKKSIPPCTIEICGQVIEELDLKPIKDAEIYTVDFAEAPFTVSGTAYADRTCATKPGPARLANAYVELQVLTCQEDRCDHPDVDPGDWGWVKEDDTTTNADGRFKFEDTLELETGDDKVIVGAVELNCEPAPGGGCWEEDDEYEYRLSIYVAASGSTVSYSSREFFKFFDDLLDPFDNQGDVEMDFTIDIEGGVLVIQSGAWCNPVVTLEETVSGLLDRTDSTGHFCFDYSKTAEPEDISVRALHTDHFSKTLTLEDVECDDQVVNFELDPLCDTIAVDGFVYDKMTGEPIESATVIAWNDRGLDMATTSATGYYFLELAFDPDDVTKVVAGAEGYTPHAESMYIPKCGYAYQTFELHQTPKSRVLLYYGNGGVGPATEAGPLTDYYTLKALYEALGFIVDYTNVWPTAFDWTLKYKLIVLLGPGHASGDNVAVHGFTLAQKADLGRYLEQGGVLVVLTDHSGFTGQAVENDLLTALGVELQFNSNSWANGLGNQIVDPVGCQTNDITVLDTNQWTDIVEDLNPANRDNTWYPGDLILQNGSANPATNCPNCVMYASDYPSHGNGEVKVIGDLNFVDDATVLFDFDWPADNEAIPLNWIICDP